MTDNLDDNEWKNYEPPNNTLLAIVVAIVLLFLAALTVGSIRECQAAASGEPGSTR